MSEIIKTEAVVLSKMNYRETSKIAVFYTRTHGKISAVIKGARSPKSVAGARIDPLNYLQIVIYKKSGRDLQLVTQTDTISYYPHVKEDLSNLKYASAVLELVQFLTVEGEINPRLFRGIVKMLSLFEISADSPQRLLLKFMLFLLKEIGYELHADQCPLCQTHFSENSNAYFNYENGIICDTCRWETTDSLLLPQELFNFIRCQKAINSAEKERCRESLSPAGAEKALFLLEKYIKYHIPEFKGIKSLYMF